ncbi:MAG: sulfocyanin-like copper-binding protein [Alicyclobacillaceae bacterium]|jgi:hypothetical protein|nr:sulfocyanin-like copper-binding protein [Alicyclobacillaceae bacterium]MCY0894857.1 sulfocyanin-like copper-binding protein [Alicyclobacillaceae bacterium]
MTWRSRLNVAGVMVVALGVSALATGCSTTNPNTLSKFLTVNTSAHTVNVELIAGYTPENDYLNFDGFAHGQLVVTVPTGYKVNFDYYNNAGIPVDIGVYGSKYGKLAFAKAGDSIRDIMLNPDSIPSAIAPGTSENIKFTADRSGTFKIANYLSRYQMFQNHPYDDLGMWATLKVVNGATPSISVS